MTNAIDISATAVGILGNIAAVLLFLSPMPTFYEIWRKKSSGDFSGVPYVASLANCLVWVLYGSPLLTHGLLPVITINGFGVVLQSFYLLIFVPFSKGKKRIQMLAYVLTVLACFGLIIVVTIFVLPEGRKAFFVGTLAAVLNTAMYAAPLSIMRHVIVTKSVAAMPFLLSLCTFFNSCFWAVYGFLKKDTFIIIPNILGVILAAAQLVLYAYYHNYEKKHPTKDVSNGNLPNVKRLETVQQV